MGTTTKAQVKKKAKKRAKQHVKEKAQQRAQRQTKRKIQEKRQDQQANRAQQQASLPTYESINLRVHEIHCIDTTKEIDRDEIVIAAVKAEGGVEETAGKRKLAGRAEAGEHLSAGKFKNGEKRNYPKTRVLAHFQPGGGQTDWPRYYVAALLLIEEDEGAIGKVLSDVARSVEKQLKNEITKAASTAGVTALTAIAAGAAAGSAVPLVGSAIGAAAGAAVGIALGQVKKAQADDVFDPKHVELRLDEFPEEPGLIKGSKKTVTFRGFKGKYKVTYSWAAR